MTTERGVDGVEVLTTMAQRSCFFGLDIGTHCDDLAERQACVENAIAGITESIKNRFALTNEAFDLFIKMIDKTPIPGLDLNNTEAKSPRPRTGAFDIFKPGSRPYSALS